MVIRRCLYCEIEFGVKLTNGERVSSGICRRHAVEQYKANGLEDEIENLNSAKEEEFCADMSQVFDG